MRRFGRALAAVVLAATAFAVAAQGAVGAECEPRSACFGLQSVAAGISTHEAGAHPDLTLSFAVKQDPASEPNAFGLHESYAPVRDVRLETPPGLVGEPNVLGVPQQCTVEELAKAQNAECPNGSQVGITKVSLYGFDFTVTEPIYMMTPPGGDVVARLGLVAGVFPTFIDLKVRSEKQNDYGLTAEISDTSPLGGFVQIDSTLWGVPAAKEHDTERCTPKEVFNSGCTESPPRPPGSLPLSFLINPTSCEGSGGEVAVSVDSWIEPGRFVTGKATLPPITGCDKLHFNPSLSVEPTSHRAAAPTGLELSYRLPAPGGVGVLESSELKDIRIDLPRGLATNTGSADGLETCSAAQVRFGEAVNSECPDAAKLADAEFDIPALPRRMKGAIYLREPEPGDPFRIWVVADDLGAHVKLPGDLEVDKATGQIRSVVMDLPQVPVREVKLLFKSGFRAPLVNPQTCGTYLTHWEFTPWSGTGTVVGDTPMTINEGCATGGFSPTLSAGATDVGGGVHSPFLFTISREDGEQNPAGLDIALPKGLAATFVGIPRCEGVDAETGACPANSRIGKVVVAAGSGPDPLWVPQAGKRPTAVYLSGPYKGAPLSIVAVVPKQAGPFDFGDEVVRSAVFVDPVTAQATAKADPLPQFTEGIPIYYRTIHVVLDRPSFTLNPTSCVREETTATITSVQGAISTPTSPFRATDCAKLPFKPRLFLRLAGGSHRRAHPALTATLRMPEGGANIAGASVALPRSEFLDQGHIKTVCTRVQFAAKACPAESIYGFAVAKTPLLEQPLEGPVYLRSSSHELPDLVVALRGPPSLPIEIDLDGRVDSVNGGIRTTFESVPDAPVSEFTLKTQGGKKGLLQNSTELCAKAHRATAKFTGQNGKVLTLHPATQSSCRKRGARRH